MANAKQPQAAVESVDPRFPNTPIGIVRSRDAFLRALPGLLANPKYDRWCVAYCGDERIGIAASEIELLRECKRRGLHPDAYYIGCIFPQSLEEEEIESGLSFVEYDDEDGTFSGAPLDKPQPKP